VEWAAVHREDDFPTNGEYRVLFQLDLHELKGGTAKATLYSNESGSFASTGVTADYDPSGGEDEWMCDELYYFLDRGSASGAAAKVKIVIDYTYPDGISETLESEEMFVYSGTFVTSSGTSVTESATGTVLTTTLTIDSSLVDPGAIDLDSTYYSLDRVIDDDNSEYVTLPEPTVERSGNTVRYIFRLTEALPSGKYRFAFALYYDEWEGNTIETFNIG